MLPENDEIRTALLQSGKQQFLAHGFDRASLRVICRNANVTTGAFYSHFEKKEDLFCSIVEPSVSAFRELFNSAQVSADGWWKTVFIPDIRHFSTAVRENRWIRPWSESFCT